MNFLLAVFILAGSVIPMEGETQEYYVVCFDDNTAVEYATRNEVLNYINTGEFEYFGDDTPKHQGYNYKKHYRRGKITRWFKKNFQHNVCDQYGRNQPVLRW